MSRARRRNSPPSLGAGHRAERSATMRAVALRGFCDVTSIAHDVPARPNIPYAEVAASARSKPFVQPTAARAVAGGAYLLSWQLHSANLAQRDHHAGDSHSSTTSEAARFAFCIRFARRATHASAQRMRSTARFNSTRRWTSNLCRLDDPGRARMTSPCHRDSLLADHSPARLLAARCLAGPLRWRSRGARRSCPTEQDSRRGCHLPPDRTTCPTAGCLCSRG